MKKRIEFICQRDLIEDSLKQKKITVRIGKPEKRHESEYACAFQLAGLGDSRIQYAYGVDGFQALIMALEGIRVAIEKSRKKISWESGEKGDYGFPRFVPMFFGAEFSHRINNMIDNQVEQFAESAKKNTRKRRRHQ